MNPKHAATVQSQGERTLPTEDLPLANCNAAAQRSMGTETDRRRFLGQVTSLAAAVALGPKPFADAAETPQSAEPMPTIQLGPHRISRLIAGSNPISGYSYLGSHTDRQMKEYFTVERTVEFLQNCERAGITAHQFADPDRAAPYLRLLRERGSKLRFFGLHAEREKLREAIALTQPVAMVHHGGVTDARFAEGKAGQVHDFVKAAHDCGVLAGVSAHNPDCIKRIADEGWEVDFFMACFYFLTRKTAKKDVDLPTLDIAYPFFKDDPKVMTQVVRQVKQPCLGFKILGAGRLCANQQTVRTAFKFAFENLKPTDGVIVGMFPWSFDEISANARFTRELGQSA
ncbi:MAG: twin-arginine translocation signal domain-containing protein [Verrucomicrobia bacterium]|nr:twin-arginine translocation signal domain-containing protein [Verrucomicrobiota bacterium]